MAVSNSRKDLHLRMVEGRNQLDGRFTEIQRIGVHGAGGAFSLLFTATDTTTNTRVALKIFDPDARNRSDSLYRWACFQREARLLQDFIAQPDIITAVSPLSQFTEEIASPYGPYPIDFAYYAMELARESIGDVIARGAADPWGIEERLIAFRQMCRGVQRIHRLEVMHRDLKPGNFLIMPDGAVKLSDFGTARYLHDPAGQQLPNYSAPQGDMDYAAPEMVALLHDPDPAIAFRADVYALGAILFELLSGYALVPFVLNGQEALNLMAYMMCVPLAKRKQVYDGAIDALASAHPLPRINDVSPGRLVADIEEPLERLYRSLAALDYRKRARNMGSVFNQVDICLRLLHSNERATGGKRPKTGRRSARAGTGGGQ